MLDRPHQPTPAEVNARACHDCAIGLIKTARNYKARGDKSEVSRLVKTARWYWHWYIWEIAR